MRQRRVFQVVCAVTLFAGVWLGLSRALVLAQLGPGTFYLEVVPPSAEQSTIRVRTDTTPNRTQIGCESFRLVSTIVNCVQITGGATTFGPAISAISAPAGDTNIDLRLQGQGTGAVILADRFQLGVTGSALTNLTASTCSISAPSGLTPFASAIGQTPCLVANSVTGNSIVNIANRSGLEAGLLIKTVTPQVAGGRIVVTFQCASSTACPTTAAQTYMWMAILP